MSERQTIDWEAGFDPDLRQQRALEAQQRADEAFYTEVRYGDGDEPMIPADSITTWGYERMTPVQILAKLGDAEEHNDKTIIKDIAERDVTRRLVDTLAESYTTGDLARMSAGKEYAGHEHSVSYIEQALRRKLNNIAAKATLITEGTRTRDGEGNVQTYTPAMLQQMRKDHLWDSAMRIKANELTRLRGEEKQEPNSAPELTGEPEPAPEPAPSDPEASEPGERKDPREMEAGELFLSSVLVAADYGEEGRVQLVWENTEPGTALDFTRHNHTYNPDDRTVLLYGQDKELYMVVDRNIYQFEKNAATGEHDALGTFTLEGSGALPPLFLAEPWLLTEGENVSMQDGEWAVADGADVHSTEPITKVEIWGDNVAVDALDDVQPNRRKSDYTLPRTLLDKLAAAGALKEEGEDENEAAEQGEADDNTADIERSNPADFFKDDVREWPKPGEHEESVVGKYLKEKMDQATKRLKGLKKRRSKESVNKEAGKNEARANKWRRRLIIGGVAGALAVTGFITGASAETLPHEAQVTAQAQAQQQAAAVETASASDKDKRKR